MRPGLIVIVLGMVISAEHGVLLRLDEVLSAAAEIPTLTKVGVELER